MNAKIFIGLTFICFNISAQESIDINLNVKHIVGGISELDRSKFITIHNDSKESDWDGDNFTKNLRKDFLEGYDVYLGRDTGGVSWYLNNIQEDPNRVGYADPIDITAQGLEAKNYFAECTWLHDYEKRKDLILATQFSAFWTGASKQPTKLGWKLAGADAAGEFIGRFVKSFHGGNGPNTPTLVEIINEPAYETLGGPSNYTNSIQEIADYHLEAAKAIKFQAPNVKIGGYTAAFPNLDAGNFKRWENRWKLFMDIAGDKMDFWSLHLYDFPSISNGKKILRSGSNMEATLDMIDHYSQLSFGKIKPYVISEFGSQMHDYMSKPWSSYRDWLHIKALNAQLMAFLERPNTIEKVLPFIVAKAEWGYWNNIPYNHRLMRKENEPESYTGKWVYTDMVKFYQLWKNVKGTRVDTKSSNLDIQVDAYINENKVYVIINNLNFSETLIQPNIVDFNGAVATKVLKKHLTLIKDKVILEEEALSGTGFEILLGAESTIVLEYTFDKPIEINETSNETKYFANTYYKPINAEKINTFTIDAVEKKEFGEAILRLGLGRDHGKSLQPKLKVNNKDIKLPKNWRGYNQADRDRFFGVLEIPVPYDVLQGSNEILVEFPDSGGHISSMSLQVFNFSKNIRTHKEVESH